MTRDSEGAKCPLCYDVRVEATDSLGHSAIGSGEVRLKKDKEDDDDDD